VSEQFGFDNMHYRSGFEYGIEFERKRIEKLLPEIIRIGNIDYLFDIEKEMPELIQDAKAIIKGEQK
jgi:hypothetical protein